MVMKKIILVEEIFFIIVVPKKNEIIMKEKITYLFGLGYSTLSITQLMLIFMKKFQLIFISSSIYLIKIVLM
jgi:hypothetical protein